MSDEPTNEPIHSDQQNDPGQQLWIRCLMQVLWPAFFGAGLTVGVLFSMIDPARIDWVTNHLHGSREAAYTAGFFILWLLFSASCAVSWYLATTQSRH